jgi:hypothetical protein
VVDQEEEEGTTPGARAPCLMGAAALVLAPALAVGTSFMPID